MGEGHGGTGEVTYCETPHGPLSPLRERNVGFIPSGMNNGEDSEEEEPREGRCSHAHLKWDSDEDSGDYELGYEFNSSPGSPDTSYDERENQPQEYSGRNPMPQRRGRE